MRGAVHRMRHGRWQRRSRPTCRQGRRHQLTVQAVKALSSGRRIENRHHVLFNSIPGTCSTHGTSGFVTAASWHPGFPVLPMKRAILSCAGCLNAIVGHTCSLSPALRGEDVVNVIQLRSFPRGILREQLSQLRRSRGMLAMHIHPAARLHTPPACCCKIHRLCS